MPLASLGRASLALLLLLVAAVPVHLTQEHVPEELQAVPEEELSEETKIQIGIEKMREIAEEMVGERNTVPLPGLPTINIDIGKISISMTLANIYLQGLDDMTVLKPGLYYGLQNKTAHATIVFKKLSLLVGSYTSAGHINNLPLNGEGPMYIHLHDFSIFFTVKWHFEHLIIPCAETGTSSLTLDLQRMETHFEHLNEIEGADLGQVVDIVIPSFGRDIVQQLDVLLSTKYYDVVDHLIVDTFNTATTCSTGNREDTLNTAQLMELTHDIIKDLVP